MPEGPEIRRAADRLAAAVLDQPLTGVFFARPELADYQTTLVGRRIVAIDTRGKAMLTRFDDDQVLYSHNQLYGVWTIARTGRRPASNRSLRVALTTARKEILLYSASEVSIWTAAELHRHPLLARLGPDVLDPCLGIDAVVARLAEPRFAGRRLAALLLDQGFLAGMGNYLRSEVLFQAGLAPDRRPRELDPVERLGLADALLDLPRRSYRSRGIRRTAGMKQDYLTDTPEGFRMLVFGRAGAPCPRCGSGVERQVQAGRRVYLCVNCQR
jgi:endonuclease-8